MFYALAWWRMLAGRAARGEALLASLQADSVKQAQRLDQLISGMVAGGDIRRGQSLFNSPKAACATCHAIGARAASSVRTS